MRSLRKLFYYGSLLCCTCTMASSPTTFASPAKFTSTQSTSSTEKFIFGTDRPSSMWTTAEGVTSEGHALLAQIKNSKNEGLDPERYQLSAISKLTSEAWHPAARDPIDQLMTNAFKQLVTDLGRGLLTPRDAQRKWFQTTQPVDLELASLSLQIPGNSIDTVIEQHRPITSAYHKLVDALAQYREIEAAGGWPAIDLGKIIRQGMTDPRIADIETRLNLTGDLPTEVLSPNNKGPIEFSKALHTAVKKFQRRHGLVEDGVIGNKTLKEMNTPVAKKIEAIEINLERVRWLPRDLGERYIITNIAEYTLRVIEHDEVVMSMPVVVGKKEHETPVFSDQVKYLVINPHWTVPTSIATAELLPDERRSPGYLARNNFELIEWKNGRTVTRNPNSIERSEYQSDRFNYTIRQKPGKKNAMGKVKFMFPNKYNIYLHDTPAKSLFSVNKRAFSHGCVRVGNPKALAETILGFDGWNKSKIEKAYQQEDQTSIRLVTPIKNHIVYHTSWVDENYQVNFRPDIYRHDIDLVTALQKSGTIELPKTLVAESEWVD